MGDIIGLGRWTGRSNAKNYRHKKFDRTKKVVTGQSQNAKNVVLKVFWQWPFWT